MGFQRGYTPTAEHRRKLSEARRGKTPWNKGLTHIYSEEALAKMSETREERIPWNKGKPCSEETKEKIRQKRKLQQITAETREKIRLAGFELTDSVRLDAWIDYVKIRDNFTCRKCGKTNLKGRDCQADHILSRESFPELIYDLNNGQTLCCQCHGKKTRMENAVR
jgi:5-methylcytosine-specific restriction endonuclease McrA